MPSVYSTKNTFTAQINPTNGNTKVNGTRVRRGDLWFNGNSGDIYLCVNELSAHWVRVSENSAGAAGTTWLRGSGVPSGGTGSNDDYYVDTDHGDVYFKSGGSWAIDIVATREIFIEELTGSSVSEVDIDLSGTYDAYVIKGQMTPASDGVQLYARFTTDGFSTIESGASDYQWVDWRAFVTGDSATASSGDSKIELAPNIGNASNELITGEIATVWYPHDTGIYTRVVSNAMRVANVSNAFAVQNAAGQYEATDDVDGIRLYFGSGNIADYELTVFGLNLNA